MPSCNEKDREYTHPKGGRLPSGLKMCIRDSTYPVHRKKCRSDFGGFRWPDYRSWYTQRIVKKEREVCSYVGC